MAEDAEGETEAVWIAPDLEAEDAGADFALPPADLMKILQLDPFTSVDEYWINDQWDIAAIAEDLEITLSLEKTKDVVDISGRDDDADEDEDEGPGSSAPLPAFGTDANDGGGEDAPGAEFDGLFDPSFVYDDMAINIPGALAALVREKLELGANGADSMTPVPEESEWPMDLKRLIELDPEVEAWDYWQPRTKTWDVEALAQDLKMTIENPPTRK
jgi:hypothetical protein